MKKIYLFPRPMLIMFTALSLFMLQACSKKLLFNQSAVVPAAEGKAKIKKDKNNNYSISVDIKNLAEPDKLQPSKSAYLVWMESARQEVRNLGQLKISSGFLSSSLKASFSTVTPYQPVRIFITAEDNTTANYPSGVTVLTTSTYYP